MTWLPENQNKARNNSALTREQQMEREEDARARAVRSWNSFQDRADQYRADNPDFKGGITSDFLEQAGGKYSVRNLNAQAAGQQAQEQLQAKAQTTALTNPTTPKPTGPRHAAPAQAIPPTAADIRGQQPPRPQAPTGMMPKPSAPKATSPTPSPAPWGGQDQLPRPAQRNSGNYGERPSTGYLSPDSEVVDSEKAREDLDYDPGYFDNDIVNGILSGDAWGVISGNPGPISRINREAIDATARQFEGRAHNNTADAFRHAYWSYRMAKELGPNRAKDIGDGHEHRPYDQEEPYNTIKKNPPKLSENERLMDLYNNRVGRELYKKYGGSGKTAEEIILQAIEDGLLRTKPYTSQTAK